MHDIANYLFNKKVYSVIDLKRAYHHIPVEPQDIPKTAIITPFGLFITYGPINRRFDHINIDIIGQLPVSKGNRYCLTCIDIFSRWQASPAGILFGSQLSNPGEFVILNKNDDSKSEFIKLLRCKMQSLAKSYTAGHGAVTPH